MGKCLYWEKCAYIEFKMCLICENFAFIASTNIKLNKTKLGRDWHQGEEKFRTSLSRAFRANGHLVAPDDIEGKIKHAEFVEKEILALYSLKKYRAMKNRYGDKARVLEKIIWKYIFAWVHYVGVNHELALASYDIECQRILEIAKE